MVFIVKITSLFVRTGESLTRNTPGANHDSLGLEASVTCKGLELHVFQKGEKEKVDKQNADFVFMV